MSDAPGVEQGELEIRQVFESEDLTDNPELIAKEEALRKQVEEQKQK